MICLFGKPEAVEAVAVGADGVDYSLARACERWCALPEALALTAGEEVVRISRHLRDGAVYTWIGLYRPAYAIGSDRPGGFYGAAILCQDEYIAGGAAYTYLRESADNLHAVALIEGDVGSRFIRKISRIEPRVDLEKIRQHLGPKPLKTDDGLDYAAEDQLFLSIPNGDRGMMEQLIESSQTDLRFRRYNSIYLSASARVLELVKSARSTTAIRLADDLSEAEEDGTFQQGSEHPLPKQTEILEEISHQGGVDRTLPFSIDELKYLVTATVEDKTAAVVDNLLSKKYGRLQRRIVFLPMRHIFVLMVLVALAFLAGAFVGKFALNTPPYLHLTISTGGNDSGESAAPQNTLAATVDTDSSTPDPGEVTAERDIIKQTIWGYFNSLNQGEFDQALNYWKTGSFSKGASTLASSFRDKYSVYNLGDVQMVSLLKDEATFKISVSGILKTANKSFQANDVLVTLAKGGAGEWKITQMRFGRRAEADPER